MDAVVARLLEKETVEKDELAALLAPVQKRAPRALNGARKPQVLAPQTPAARKAARGREPKV
jgi:hypothetical protein